MSPVGFRRLFWIGAAALLGVAALIAIAALLRGEFTDTDGQILATLGLVLACGSACLTGLTLIDRNDWPFLGWISIAIGIGSFAVVTYQVWTDWDGDEELATALLLLGVALLATTGRLLLRRSSLEPLYGAHLILSTFATAGTVWVIWDGGDTEDWWGKALGTVWILAGLAWFLIPVLGRSQRDGKPAERVVGRGPGRVEVELAEGETLVVRS